MIKLVGSPDGNDGISRYAYDLRGYLKENPVSFDVLHAVQPISSWMVTAGGLKHTSISKPFVVTCHDLAPLREDTEKKNDLKSKVFIGMFKKRVEESFQKADVIIANSSITASDIESILPAYVDKVRVISMGIGKDFKPNSSIGSHLRVGCCTRSMWRAEKVMEVLTKMNVDAHLYPLRWIPMATVNQYYYGVDVFLHCSTNEGFGYPILEAQACGTPVIVFSDARIPFEVRKYAALADSEYDAAQKIVDYKKIDIKAPGEYARTFTVEKMGAETVKAYAEALE